jgi:regulator of protease activity HflC (stomatin/prohibitin superfamily)
MDYAGRLSLIVAVAMLPLGAGCSYAHVGAGELAVVRTPSGMQPVPLETGDWSVGGSDEVRLYNARSQQRSEHLEVLAANGLKIVLDTSVRYHVLPGEVVQLDKELGPQYYSTLIGPTLSSQARRVIGRYQPEEIYSTERELIERQISEGVVAAIKGRHVELEAILIRNVQLPDTIQAAINDKLQAEQHALKMKFVIAEAQSQTEKELLEQKAQVERQQLAAEGKAQALRVDAQAQADSKRIEGQATSDYQRSLQQTLSDGILRYYQIQATRDLASAPNSKLVFLGGAKPPETKLDLRTTDAKSD